MQKNNFKIRTLVVSPTRQLYPKEDQEQSSAFKIIKAKILKHNDESRIGKIITIKGNMHPVAIGAEYEATGEPVYDGKFKEWQFKITEWLELRSMGRIGIAKYLVQCDGVGQVLAGRIYDLYGDESVEELAKCDPFQLAPKLKISSGKAEIVKEWAIAEGLNAELKQLLFKAGLQPFQVATAMKHLGDKAYKVIKENCYDLTKLPGFGFKSVDAIAMKLGIEKEDEGRIRQGLVYALKTYCDETGSVCCSQDRLMAAACDILRLQRELVLEQIKGMTDDGIFVCE